MMMRRELTRFIPSTRNPLEKSSVAQSLDGSRLKGSLLFPVLHFRPLLLKSKQLNFPAS
jgi:hypothetical protein